MRNVTSQSIRLRASLGRCEIIEPANGQPPTAANLESVGVFAGSPAAEDQAARPRVVDIDVARGKFLEKSFGYERFHFAPPMHPGDFSDRSFCLILVGGRCWNRTSDPRRVKAMLYR